MLRQTRLMTVFTFTFPLRNTWYARLTIYLLEHTLHKNIGTKQLGRKLRKLLNRENLKKESYTGSWVHLLENQCHCVGYLLGRIVLLWENFIWKTNWVWMWKSPHLHSELGSGVGGGWEGTIPDILNLKKTKTKIHFGKNIRWEKCTFIRKSLFTTNATNQRTIIIWQSIPMFDNTREPHSTELNQSNIPKR